MKQKVSFVFHWTKGLQRKAEFFCICYFWRTKRKSTETITERCFSCQNKSVGQKLAWSCKKWKSAKKAIYALLARRPSIDTELISGSKQFKAQFRFWGVLITTLYNLMLQSWYQKTAQPLVNMLLYIFCNTIGCHSNSKTPGGVLGISSDGDDRMEPKVKTQKNPLGFQQNSKKSLDQKLTPQNIPCRFCGP